MLSVDVRVLIAISTLITGVTGVLMGYRFMEIRRYIYLNPKNDDEIKQFQLDVERLRLALGKAQAKAFVNAYIKPKRNLLYAIYYCLIAVFALISMPIVLILDLQIKSVELPKSGFALQLILMGLVALSATIKHARSNQDVRDSEVKITELKNRFGVFANQAARVEWQYRMVYRHPILMRLPGLAILAVGLALVGGTR